MKDFTNECASGWLFYFNDYEIWKGVNGKAWQFQDVVQESNDESSTEDNE
jgi:hypothetical protein